METPTLEQLQLDLQEIKECLSELNDLQKLELLEIRKNRVVNSRRLASVGNRLFQLILLAVLGGSAMFLYKGLDPSTRNKVAESYITQLAPVAIGLLGAQQLVSNRREQAKLRDEDDEDDEKNDLLDKYLRKAKEEDSNEHKHSTQ